MSEDTTTTTPEPEGLDRILQIELEVAVHVADRNMDLEEVLEFKPGLVIEFEQSADSALTLQINSQSIALGFAVKTGEQYGLRIDEIGAPEERIRMLGGL